MEEDVWAVAVSSSLSPCHVECAQAPETVTQRAAPYSA